MLQQSRIRSRLALSAQETPSAQTLESYVQNTFDDNLCNKRELQWKSHGFVTAALVVLEHSFVALRFPSWLAHSLTFSSPLCSQCPFVRVLFFFSITNIFFKASRIWNEYSKITHFVLLPWFFPIYTSCWCKATVRACSVLPLNQEDK